MKKFILLSILITALTTSAFAQAGDVEFVNNTQCHVFVVMVGDVSGSCGTGMNSISYIIQAGFSSIVTPPSFPASGFFGGGTEITGAFIYDGDQSVCMFSNPPVFIGEPCATSSTTTPSYSVNMPDGSGGCVICGEIVATWTPAPTPGGTAILTFN